MLLAIKKACKPDKMKSGQKKSKFGASSGKNIELTTPRMSFRILIVDDEQDSRTMIRRILEKHSPDVTIVGDASGVSMAEQLLRSHDIDLVLLDVQMEDGTGFDLLDRFKIWHFNVIFTTAHDEFAVRAFRYHAIDYLLKPVIPEDLVEAVNNAKARSDNEMRQKQFEHLLETTTNRSFDRLTLNTSNGPIFVNTQEISHIETYGNYVFVFLVNNERHLVSRNLKEFEEMLPEPAFFRIHQSHMVNTAMVKKFEKDDGGYAVMKSGAKLPVARRRKEEFLKALTGN